jgi:NitT/TauT family transport system substrate-binding protein
MTFLFASYDRANFSLYSNPKIRSVQELKGKRIGVSSFGSGPDSLLRDFLNDHGIEAGRDATILAVGTGMERFLSLKSGAVDAAMLSPSAYIMAEDAGYRELVGFVRQASYVYLQGGIIVRNDLLKSDLALVEKFVRGSLKGLLYAQANRQPTVAMLTRVLKVTQDVATRTYDEVRPGITQDGTVGEAQQKKALTAFLEKNKEPPPLAKIFDFSLARKAATDLKAQQWRPAP